MIIIQLQYIYQKLIFVIYQLAFTGKILLSFRELFTKYCFYVLSNFYYNNIINIIFILYFFYTLKNDINTLARLRLHLSVFLNY